MEWNKNVKKTYIYFCIPIQGVDMLNGTPSIDIKPFFSKFVNRTNTESGCMDDQGNIPIEERRSDERFKLKLI